MLKSGPDIAEGILQLRTNLGLPPTGGQAVSNLLASLRAELAILIRRHVTVEFDKSVLQEVNMEETTIKILNDRLPHIRSLMTSQSVYGADGLEKVGRCGGQAPPGAATGDLGGAGGSAAGGVDCGAPAPNITST